MKWKITDWIVRGLIALAFAAASLGKLTSNPGVLEMFAEYGFPQGFHLVIGVLELGGAIALLLPKFRRFAIGLLGIVVIGAAGTHLIHDPMIALLRPLVFAPRAGPRAGQKAFTLQTLPPLPERLDDEPPYLAKANGFSLHAGVCAQAFERDKLERLCRYITRPPVADQRISLTPNGNIRYELKTPYRDGTTHVILEPMDFMPQGTFSIAARSHLVARLAALVPRPRVNLTRYHGVFAPSSRLRGQITPARRGKGGRPGTEPTEDHEHEPARPRQAMTWAQRLRRVFNIDIETCDACGGPMKVIASIEDPDVIGKILNHLEKRQTPQQRPPTRGPPCFFD